MKHMFRFCCAVIALMCIKPAFHNGFHAVADDQKPVSGVGVERVFGAVSTVLENGLKVVVISNHRAPILTHMLWIRTGAADEESTDSGVAHYLEHLMFKGTKTAAPGAYSRDIAALGGDENAFTGQDFTAYFATISPEHLPKLMAMERDRFLNLAPPADHAASELDVVIEERRQRTENDPLGAVQEQLNSILFGGSDTAGPVIGWMDDIKTLTLSEALAFKQKWYTAPNMILVISGDITSDAAFALARRYYGDLPATKPPPRDRLSPPRFPAPVALSFKSDRVAQPQIMMGWRAPSYVQNAGMSNALSVMADVLDGGASTRLYRELVVEGKRASSIDLSYDDSALGDGTVWIAATPAPGVKLIDLQADIFAALDRAAREMTDAEVTGAITRLTRQAVFARDSVAGPAMIVGQALATGATLDQIETWPAQIRAVTPDAVRGAITSILRCDPHGDAPCQPPVIAHITPAAGAIDPSAARMAPPAPLPTQSRMH